MLSITLSDVVDISQLIVSIVMVIGIFVALIQLQYIKNEKLLSSFSKAIEYIADEKFGTYNGMFLRHWIVNLKNPLTLSRFQNLDPEVRDNILSILVNHDRLAFLLTHSGNELGPLRKFQLLEIQAVYNNLIIIILHIRNMGHKDFCKTMESYVSGKDEQMDVKIAMIKGVVTKGDRIASGKSNDNPYPKGSIELQAPIFNKRGLNISNLYKGTVNVDISPLEFNILSSDYTFPQVRWVDNYPPETFSFVECAVQYAGRRYDGYIYYPHPETKIGHFKSNATVEIVLPYIDGLTYGDNVDIELDLQKIEIRCPESS